MKPILKIVFVILLLLTIIFLVLLFTTEHFEITFPLFFIFFITTFATLLTSSDFDDIIELDNL